VLEDFRSAEDTSTGETGGMSLNAGRMRGGGGEGLGGKKCCRSVLLISVRGKAFSSVGKPSGAMLAVIFLASHTERESTSARNCDQWTRLADFDGLELCVPGYKGLSGQGLILSHEPCEIGVDAAELCELWSPPWFRVGG